MFCVTCGTAIVEKANFCHSCGRGFAKTDLNDGSVENGTSDMVEAKKGYDAIPPHGMPKKIDVYFTEEKQLPQVSTCGLTVTIPLTSPDFEVATAIKTAMTFGCGFGSI